MIARVGVGAALGTGAARREWWPGILGSALILSWDARHVTAAGAVVSALLDTSGQGRDLTNAEGAYTVATDAQGRPYIACPGGVGSGLRVTGLPAFTACTIAAVCTIPEPAANYPVLYEASATGVANSAVSVISEKAFPATLDFRYTSGHTAVSANNYRQPSLVRLIATFDAASRAGYVNGVQVAAESSAIAPVSMTRLVLGGIESANTNAWAGQLGIGCAINRVLTAAEIASLDSYLKNAWQL